MKKIPLKSLVFLLAIVNIMGECEHIGFKYNQGYIPKLVVNLEEYNSEYDDYNSTAPSIEHMYALCFSTNRTDGNNYDIIKKLMHVSFSREDGSLYIGGYIDWDWDITEVLNILDNALPLVNSTANEYGPYIKSVEEIQNNLHEAIGNQYLFMFASDQGGDLDIKLVHNIEQGNQEAAAFSGPYPIEIINSAFNDAYPAFNATYDRLYFCSDREGKFDILSIEVDLSANIADSLIAGSSGKEITRSEVLSSDHDDKCPYIYKNAMVFTSNRPGGFGGYDLYYSLSDGSEWGEPVNLGSAVNTEFDEFRPVYVYLTDFTNDMLIFSSNRPGGKGGFDLYYTGIDRLVSWY